MTISRKRVALFSAVALVALASGALLSRDRYDDVWKKYGEIREGMTEDQVIEIFGVPPGQYNSGPLATCGTGQTEAFEAVEVCHSSQVWEFDAGVFEIGFDEGLRVQKKVASANLLGSPSPWKRLIRSLGL